MVIKFHLWDLCTEIHWQPRRLKRLFLGEKKYLLIWKIIDTRSDTKFKGSFHQARCYLNPYFYYQSLIENEKDGCFMNCLKKFYLNDGNACNEFLSQRSNYQYIFIRKRGCHKPSNLVARKAYDPRVTSSSLVFATSRYISNHPIFIVLNKLLIGESVLILFTTQVTSRLVEVFRDRCS